MKEFSNCKAAVDHCIESHTFSVAYLYHEEKTMEMHIHDCYELYYSISGGRQFLIGDRCYDIKPGDLFVTNQYESHYVSQLDEGEHERIVISIWPEFLERLSSPRTDLTECFRRRTGEFSNRVRLDADSQKRLIYYAHKITGTEGFGAELIDNAALTELMVMINAKFREKREPVQVPAYQYSRIVMDMIEYINRHITERLTISALAAHFYVSESYVCRVFKSETGTTVNKYLTARRISIAKNLLVTGGSVTEACEKSGFHDYVNFVRSFTRAVGLSPKRYARCSAN